MDTTRVEWTDNLENYFKELGEQSLCLSMLHKKAEAYFSIKAQRIDLPVIVFSTICGSLSLSANSLFGSENEQIAMTGVGVLSLFTGILGTIQAYFSYSRRAESHRNSYLEYSKLYRFIKIELGLPRIQRILAKDLLKIVNDMFERLNEISNLLPETIVDSFKKKYKKNTTITRPEIANGLHPISIFVESSDSLEEVEEKEDLV